MKFWATDNLHVKKVVFGKWNWPLAWPVGWRMLRDSQVQYTIGSQPFCAWVAPNRKNLNFFNQWEVQLFNGQKMTKFNKWKISGVPLEIFYVPLGVRAPQVGNRCCTPYLYIFKRLLPRGCHFIFFKAKLAKSGLFETVCPRENILVI